MSDEKELTETVEEQAVHTEVAANKASATVDDAATYAQVKERLDAIVVEVRRKDIPLEQSLDLLEEGVRLANQCTELIDQAAWDTDDASFDDDVSAGGEETDDTDNKTDEPAVGSTSSHELASTDTDA